MAVECNYTSSSIYIGKIEVPSVTFSVSNQVASNE